MPAKKEEILTLAYPVRLYPTRVKSDMLGMLGDCFIREHHQQLDFLEGIVAQEGRLSLKGQSQAGEGEFKQRVRHRAVNDYKRCKKAARKLARKAQTIAEKSAKKAERAAKRAAEKHTRENTQRAEKTAKMAARKAEQATRALAKETKLPYLHAVLCDAAEVQEPRKAKGFDLWVHIEGLAPSCQLYLPAKKHKALNRALEYPGAKLSRAAQVMRKNGKWYAIIYVRCPLTSVYETKEWYGCDVGVRAAVTRSDGYKGPDLRPILKKQKNKTAERQRQGMPHDFGRQTPQRQVLAQEARRLVLVALATGRGIALEDPRRLPRWRQWAARYFAKRVILLASLVGVPVRMVAPAYTSVTCSRCGAAECFRDRACFRCKACGFTHNADYNAACNIRSRVYHYGGSPTSPKVFSPAGAKP